MVDFNLDSGNPIKSRDIDLVLQQIDILFDTYNGEVFGDPTFGTNYEKFLYNLQLPNAYIENQIRSDLNQLNLCGFESNVNVYILKGSEHDIIIADITLSKMGQNYNKTYRVS